MWDKKSKLVNSAQLWVGEQNIKAQNFSKGSKGSKSQNILDVRREA